MREHVFFETSTCGYQCPDSVKLTWLLGVRTRDWELVQRREPGIEPAYQLYDLIANPQGKADVAGSRPGQLSRLKGMLAVSIFDDRAALVRVRSQMAETAGDSAAQVTEAVKILNPGAGDTLAYEDLDGTITVLWSGQQEAPYRIEYEVGGGRYQLTGSFIIWGNSQSYRLFTRIFWRTLP
jgi:roadblock/LC7 domain-containing protein